MAYGVKLKVWGDFACFTRPEMKVERVSYDVMTPSAARAVLEAVYWKPPIRWIVDRIHVLKPIRFMNIRRNEVGCKIPLGNITAAMKDPKKNLALFIEDERQQRAAIVLRDVCYGLRRISSIPVLRITVTANTSICLTGVLRRGSVSHSRTSAVGSSQRISN
jgi:CRISPR-associated protein Cas5d